MELIKPIYYVDKSAFIRVDDWVPNEEDQIFKHCKGAIVIEGTSKFYGVAPGDLDMYILSQKRAYNNLELREHLCLYMNYFEKFYDLDKELLAVYYRIKYLIDYEPSYNLEAFKYDIQRYILHSNIRFKLGMMNIDNYNLNLTYRNKKNPGLQYNDEHGKALYEISLLMNTLIPLLTHYIYVNKIMSTNNFLLEMYDMLFELYPMDIFNKLFETSISNITRSGENHSLLWDLQAIRGNNTTTHSLDCVGNIVLNIIPKYVYNMNIIKLNYASINNNTSYRITDIGYEFSFISLSSSRRDVDNNSEFDKFESYLTKADNLLSRIVVILYANFFNCWKILNVDIYKFRIISSQVSFQFIFTIII